MKTVVSTLVVMAIMVASLAAQSPSTGGGTQAPAAAKTKAANYYPLKPGTKWHYLLERSTGEKIRLTSQISEIKNINGKELALLEVFADGQKIAASEHLQGTAEGVFRVRMNNVELTPPICLIKYPVKPGQTWGADMTVSKRRMNLQGTEGKPEDVGVPAGKYRAVPCTIVVSDATDKSTTVFWFAEDVGIVKQRSEDESEWVTMELIKYEPAK